MTSALSTGAAGRRLVFLCGLGSAAIITVLTIYQPSTLSRLDRAVYDTLARSAPAHPPGGHVVIVDVDERSLAEVGQWPWPRDVVAALIERLRDRGASVIALDIIFAEPDRHSVRRISEGPAGTPHTSDEVLRRTVHDRGVVLGYAMTFDPHARARRACELHPISLATLHSREDAAEPPYFSATDAVCSLPMLARSAGSSGFLNAAPDADGILRRVPLLIELGGSVYPSLALAAVAARTGARDMALRVSNVNASSLIVEDRVVPLDGKGNLLLRYRGKKNTFRYVSAADALSGAVPADTLRDKIVFVGTTALGTREVVATPLDTLFAGVEVQATVADNLLQQDFFRRPVFATAAEGQTVLILGTAIAVVVAKMGIVSGAIAATGGVAAVWFGSIWLLAATGSFVSPLFPTIGSVCAFAVMTLAKFAVERLRADRAGREKTTAQRLMVQTLLSLTEVRDAETGSHSRRTQEYARLLAQQLSRRPEFQRYLTPDRITLLSSLAPLHDIGKVGIPDHILHKPSALTAEELADMRKHPVIGREVILNAEQHAGVLDDEILELAKEIVYTHHERWDGKGYPRGLRGSDIPVAGRIMAVVDVYDAAVTRTLYRPTVSHEEAVAFIAGAKGTQFDPAVVEAFLGIEHVFKTISAT